MSDRKYTLTLPFFPGFYESMLSSAIDSAEECDAEALAEKEIPVPQDEPKDLRLVSEAEEPRRWQPEHLRISASEYADILFKCTDYQKTYLQVAQCWADAFDDWCHENLETPVKSFTWESMSSPKEYNFTTARCFIEAPAAVIGLLFDKSAKAGHQTLAKVIKANFTSYDGFMSFYSNDIEAWLEKPLEEWDHNEIGTLVAAAIQGCDEWSDRDAFNCALYERTFSGNGEDDRVIDQEKFDLLVSQLRSKKAQEATV